MGVVATAKSFRVSIPSKLGPLAIRSMTWLLMLKIGALDFRP
jgi:hypothetical protein